MSSRSALEPRRDVIALLSLQCCGRVTRRMRSGLRHGALVAAGVCLAAVHWWLDGVNFASRESESALHDALKFARSLKFHRGGPAVASYRLPRQTASISAVVTYRYASRPPRAAHPATVAAAARLHGALIDQAELGRLRLLDVRHHGAPRRRVPGMYGAPSASPRSRLAPMPKGGTLENTRLQTHSPYPDHSVKGWQAPGREANIKPTATMTGAGVVSGGSIDNTYLPCRMRGARSVSG